MYMEVAMRKTSRRTTSQVLYQVVGQSAALNLRSATRDEALLVRKVPVIIQKTLILV